MSVLVREYFNHIGKPNEFYKDNNYMELNTEATMNMVKILMLDKNEVNKIIDDAIEKTVFFPLLVAHRRWDNLELNKYISKDALIVYLVYSEFITTPGKAVMVLIDMIMLGEELERPIEVNDIFTQLYPLGFPKDEICVNIIDTLLKPKKIKWANIY